MPPEVGIIAPSEGIVGEEIILTADVFDWDGDPVEVSWVQYHNPDKYTGLEYVTGNDARICSLDGQLCAVHPNAVEGLKQVKFVPDWPGNYRFQVAASDRDGVSAEFVDVLVRPIDVLFEIYGVAIYFPWNEMIEDEILRLIDRAASLGGNTILLRVHYHTTDGSSEVGPCHRFSGALCTTPTAAQLRQYIDHAHDQGLRVFLEADVLMGDDKLEPWQVDITDKLSWLASYYTVLEELSALAEELQVEVLSLGCDLGWALELDGWSPELQVIRNLYEGEVTLTDSGLTFGSYPGAPNPPVYFRAELDFLSFPWAYHYRGGSHPSVHQLVSDIGDQFAGTTLPQLRAVGNPYMSSALGLLNADGASGLAGSPGGPLPSVIDNQEQVDYFETALRLLHENGSRGVIFWSYNPEVLGGLNQVNYEIEGRPAEQLIPLWAPG